MKTRESIIIGLIVIISLLTGFKISQWTVPGTIHNLTSGEAAAFYLYPQRCIDCEKRIPPTCQDCNTYYNDPGILDEIGKDLGLHLGFYVSDAVPEPSVFVVSGAKAGLGNAKNKLSIAGTICAIAGHKTSCDVFAEKLDGIKGCVSEYGITPDTIIYHYDKGCVTCEGMNGDVKEMEGLDYGGQTYNVFWADDSDKTQMKVLEECAGDVISLGYAPQVFCPANGWSKTGLMDLAQLRDFADDCIDASLG